MPKPAPKLIALFMIGVVIGGSALPSAAEEPTTGPATEKRFPPLVVPAGFKATLFACDPLVEYPSVIALGPRAGTLFVAHDYMTGLGTEIIRRDEIRLIEDTDGDGYADRSTVYAGGFNSLQGLAYHAGQVFAMHAPLLTVLRDSNGDGVADERRDLFDGLGLQPEKNPSRLHCANGVAVGHDGWLYLAMGDNGTDVKRPEGDRLLFQEGGILRCRADGTDLHVFSSGLRNIYDVALDEDLEVFVRDNENDGGDYMIRVCHSFHGADHGYPYLYYERPEEAVTPLADLGRGSSAGGACYLESTFPPEYRGHLFFCEWGRAVVRYGRERQGSGFGPTKEIDFATGAATDPYGFKPTDVIVDRDGSLIVSDWCDGQRPKRGRARIYRISYEAPTSLDPTGKRASPATVDSWIAALDSPSYHERLAAQLALHEIPDAKALLKERLARRDVGVLARLHAVWILSLGEGQESLETLFELAEQDPEPRVRVQAIRAIADLTDPILVDDRLDAGSGNRETAMRLATLAEGADPRVQLAAVVAMGRLRWAGAPQWLRTQLRQPDAPLSHAAMQTLRRCENWPSVLELLDEPDSCAVREIALRALARQTDAEVVAGLMQRLGSDPDPQHRRQYADALARAYRKPGDWVYWGYRPAPRTPNPVDWEQTPAIGAALDRALADADVTVRADTLRRLQREAIPIRRETLARWLREDRDASRVSLMLASLEKLAADETRGLFGEVVRDRTHATESRKRALALLMKSWKEADGQTFLALARDLEDGPVLVDLLAAWRGSLDGETEEFFLGKLASPAALVRSEAIQTLARLTSSRAGDRVAALLQDADPAVRRGAARAAGPLRATAAIPLLLDAAREEDPRLREALLDSLRQLNCADAVTLAHQSLRDATSQRAAVEYLAAFGGPSHVNAVQAVASTTRSVELLSHVMRAFDQWYLRSSPGSSEREQLTQAMTRLQGDTGLLLRWRRGPADSPDQESSVGPTMVVSDADSKLTFTASDQENTSGQRVVSEFYLHEPARLQFLGSSSLPWQVLINGNAVYKQDQAKAFQADAERFEIDAQAGMTRVAIQSPATQEAWQVQLRFRRVSSSAEHERLTRHVLQNVGNIERGRELFLNAEKSLCNKCHRLGEQGGTIGPDLTGIGRRFSKIHLIESILEPGRTIAPSYETVTVALSDGRVVSGVRVSETDQVLTLGDDQGKLHEVLTRDIDERSSQPRSTMPDGLEKRFSDREFLDLIAFLMAQVAS